MNAISLLFSALEHAISWNDVYVLLLKYCFSDKKLAGTIFEVFCKYYYLAEPSVKHDYKNVWLFSEIPLSVREKLNIGKIDHGVDLVLEEQSGSFSVVQCKFRNNQNTSISWTKDNLANLFAEGDKADRFIVFTNASGIDKHSLSKKSSQLKLVSLGDLLSISSSTFNEMKNCINGRATKNCLKKPREYQKIAIKNVVDGFKTKNRGQLILPCGAGKTLVSLWIKNKLKSKRTLVLVPSLALLRQIKNEWSANSERYIPYICVCSEEDIDKNKDSNIAHLYEIGGEVSTDPHTIKNFLNRHDEAIVYSTYQSLEAVSKAINDSPFTFDFAICDEAHKTAGSKFSKFGLIHSEHNTSIKKRLYMTATPRILSRITKNNMGDDIQQYICDMNNPEIFGSEFHRMSFKDAITAGILVDYKIIAIGVDDKEINDAISQRKYISDDTTIDEIANNYALEKFMEEHEATHAITFHASVKKAKAFQSRHKGISPGTAAFHVNGLISTNERACIMKEFEDSFKSVMTKSKFF